MTSHIPESKGPIHNGDTISRAERSKATGYSNVTIQTELLQAGIYSQNSDHVKLQLVADVLHAMCLVRL